MEARRNQCEGGIGPSRGAGSRSSRGREWGPRRDGDRGDAGDEALGSELGERVELGGAGGAVGDAGVFVNVLKGGEEPEPCL